MKVKKENADGVDAIGMEQGKVAVLPAAPPNGYKDAHLLTMGGDLQPGCLADQLRTAFDAQPGE